MSSQSSMSLSAGWFRRHRGAVCLGAGVALLVTWAAASGLRAATSSPQQERPRGTTQVCANESCHASIVQRPVMHRPTTMLQCLECHEYAVPEQHLFRLTVPGSELCAKCHTMPLEQVVHEPVQAGNCTGCHDPHGSEHRHVLVEAPGRGLCLECHKQDFSKKEFVHGPVAIGACVVCHDAHSSHQDHLLTNAPDRLCLECHVEVTPEGAAARHLHKPMDDGCTTCHDPHASDARFHLTDTLPDLCLTCHEGMSSLIAGASVVHGPAIGDRGCVDCHSPHFSALPRLQKTTQPELCLECHDQSVPANDGRPLTNMARLLEENTNHHGPIRDGGCTGCHDAHAGEHFRLLSEDYPPEFYAPFEEERYALCFTCHIVDLVIDESGTGLTGFRDGDRNLHWLHVNRQKGRTCRACHEVHASSRPFHMRETVPFGRGDWMLEINFEKTPDGGTCTPGCHKLKTYTRTGADSDATGTPAP
ncbi:MAG: cytochrome c3 family protein [Planctomycetota bacterium]|jgi:predicted CXXCH cytochrome family protein